MIIRRVYLDEQGRRCTQFVASVHCTAGHEDEQIPTAELVVRAVNAHEALVAALTELLRVDDEWHGSVNSQMSHARSQARAAIALVKGGPVRASVVRLPGFIHAEGCSYPVDGKCTCRRRERFEGRHLGEA